MKTKTFIVILILIFAGLFSIKANQHSTTQLNSNQSINLIDSRMAPWVDLGQTNSLAGLLWIQSVSYFGGSLMEGGNSHYLGNILESTTTLDPKFLSAYQWAGLFDQVSLEDAEPLLEKGINEFPEDWQLHLIYANKVIELDSNFKKASSIMKTQITNISAPKHVRSIWKTYSSYTLDINLAVISLTEKLFGNSSIISDEYVKKIKALLKDHKPQATIDKAIKDIRTGNTNSYRRAIHSLRINNTI